MLSKRETTIQELNRWTPHLLCPHCHQPLKWENNQLRCQNRHSFDIAKSGYLNLAPQHHEKHYTKDLFIARQLLMNDYQFYGDIYQQMMTALIPYLTADKPQRMLDLGTGEGTHFIQFLKAWQNHQYPEVTGMGIDLAKAGIQLAAKQSAAARWTIADLSHIPLADNSIDGILTILSPANYQEIKRVLKPNGWILKIIPGPNYLKELRACVLPPEDVINDGQSSIQRFNEQFTETSMIRYQRDVPLSDEANQALQTMTPLMWHASKNQRTQASQLHHIQVDLHGLIGKNN